MSKKKIIISIIAIVAIAAIAYYFYSKNEEDKKVEEAKRKLNENPLFVGEMTKEAARRGVSYSEQLEYVARKVAKNV